MTVPCLGSTPGTRCQGSSRAAILRRCPNVRKGRPRRARQPVPRMRIFCRPTLDAALASAGRGVLSSGRLHAKAWPVVGGAVLGMAFAGRRGIELVEIRHHHDVPTRRVGRDVLVDDARVVMANKVFPKFLRTLVALFRGRYFSFQERQSADRTNNRSKRDGCEVRLIDGALGGSLQRRPLSPLRMWRWTLETERSRETAVTWVAVAAWRQAVVSTGACPGIARRGALC